jgi:hypothetical protein
MNPSPIQIKASIDFLFENFILWITAQLPPELFFFKGGSDHQKGD